MNVFKVPSMLSDQELFEQLIPDNGVLIERIISTGQISPKGFWYNQDRDEWVVLLQGEATIKWYDGRQQKLAAGDYIFIPAHEKHRVEKTSNDPPCIWIAVHGKLR